MENKWVGVLLLAVRLWLKPAPTREITHAIDKLNDVRVQGI
jgi:hypothetical protein